MAIKPVPRIGVDKLYYAKIISDTAEGTTYAAPVWMQGVNNITYNPNVQTQDYDADDGTYDSYSSDGAIQTTIAVADLLPHIYADLLGLQIGPTGMVIEGEDDNAPEVAVGFRSQMSNGAYRYIWVLKGKFAKQQEDYATKGSAGITYNQRSIMHTALKRISDGARRKIQDSNADGLALTNEQLASAVTGWFSSPNFDPAVAPGTVTPITGLTAAAGANAGEITAAWGTATGASSISVQVSSGGEWVTVSNPDPAETSTTITGLVAGGSYLVRVFVVGGENAGISNVVSATAGTGGGGG